MVNVRCQACQAKYRLLAAKRVNLLGLVLEARPIGKQNAINYDGSNSNGSSRSSSYNNVSGFGGKPAPRFPYRPPIQRRPRSYILPPPSPTACGCPFYWKSILFIASGGEKLGNVSLDTFADFWKKIIANYHDEASRFVQLLTLINPNGNSGGHRCYLIPEDFVPLVQDVVDTHPGLTFLKEAAEFHSRYVHTVIARIFYNVNRSWSGHITLAELRHSNLLSTVRLLEEEEDINQITDFFSYEHFYVIYCKFWELDKDHDLFIDKKDLARHNDHALSSKMIDRIFSGAVTRGSSSHSNKLAPGTNININNQPRMSYTEFVWFLISEEDKRHPTAIEYWFRCMDLDGDGYISMYELEYFYEEQLQRMESLGIETLPFEDCLCQMLDMIHPAVPGKVSLNDLKRCQMTPIFFDTFFNLEKYLDHEQRDPFASQRDPDSENGEDLLKISDWDRYAAEEYELLVAEEGSPDHNEDIPCQYDEQPLITTTSAFTTLPTDEICNVITTDEITSTDSSTTVTPSPSTLPTDEITTDEITSTDSSTTATPSPSTLPTDEITTDEITSTVASSPSVSSTFTFPTAPCEDCATETTTVITDSTSTAGSSPSVSSTFTFPTAPCEDCATETTTVITDSTSTAASSPSVSSTFTFPTAPCEDCATETTTVITDSTSTLSPSSSSSTTFTFPTAPCKDCITLPIFPTAPCLDCDY
uniref:EOG090X00JH n=1 Tax=Eubosmina coregoni TaxID=186181 RepID=A0A4Y7LQ00_9CRUS|nr:EOG090X00JH [Eubosmina coregoni]SVE69625.1 EOG090X00JH [Eubosmina coregoni]